MKQGIIIYCILLHSLPLVSQQSGVNPRLILPIGHTDWVRSAVFSPDGLLALTASDDAIARIYQVATGNELQVLRGHTGPINSAVFSPDGLLALTASDDAIARIYEVATGKELQVLRGHTGSVRSAVFSPDGQLVLMASIDNTARIYQVATGKELQVLRGHTGSIQSAVFSPDGQLALTASYDTTARIYQVATGKELQVFRGHNDMVNSAVFSPDGQLALTASYDATARIYQVATGIEMQVLEGHTEFIQSAVFSPDGQMALTASFDNTARIYQVATGNELQVLRGHTGPINSAVFSPDGLLALTASFDNTARIYQVATGKELQVFRGHNDMVNSAVFSPDGQQALTASFDNTARIYQVATGIEMQVLEGHTGSINFAIFSPDGQLALTASYEHTARIYQVATGKELQVFRGHNDLVNSAVFSPDGQLALTASDYFGFGSNDSTARIYQVATGKELQVLRGHTASINSVVFSPDGHLALTASLDKTARIYQVATGKELQVFRGVNSANFSPDGQLVLTANGYFSVGPDNSESYDSTARIYEVATGKELQVLIGHTSCISSAIFSPDGQLALTASFDNTARIYEVATGKELQVFRGHTDWVKSAVFSPDGQLALTASYDTTARIYQVATGKILQVLRGHTDWIYSAVFSPDGQLALTVSNNTARIYKVATGKELQVLSGHTSTVRSAVFSPDGKTVLTTGDDHKTILWDATTGKPLYTRLLLESGGWLVYDEHYRFDGTPGAIDKLYLVCGLEVVDLSQVKDSLWVPGLIERIMNNQPIFINDRIAPKLTDLNICELTPVIEPIEKGEKGDFRYKIIPRKGGLGATEVYINGNLTYSFKTEELEKQIENKKEVYYLTIASDTLQKFLVGKKQHPNPIVVKSKVKNSGIYGRGVKMEIEKRTEEEQPVFYGVFIGVNDYANSKKEASDLRYRDLDFAAKDANDMASAVEATVRNLFKDSCYIYRLTSDGENAPSKENIQRVLKEIGIKSKSSDILYVFFAGHGDIDDKSGERDIRFMLHQADKRNMKTYSFGVEELSKWCHPQHIKAQKRVFVFDACHSGQIINQTMAFNGRGDEESIRIRQLDKLKDKNGMMILAASAENESAYEDETLNQGVLTYHMLQSIKEQKQDTSLVIRAWFDETIQLVKEYSRINGNKQEPSSFGDGRFEIGNINEAVRNSIKIECPKIRIGKCFISDPDGNAEKLYPTLKEKVNLFFAQRNSRGSSWVYSRNPEKSYRIEGTYSLDKNKLQVRYKLYFGDNTQPIGQPITLSILKNKTEDEVVEIVVQSVQSELERIENKNVKCK